MASVRRPECPWAQLLFKDKGSQGISCTSETAGFLALPYDEMHAFSLNRVSFSSLIRGSSLWPSESLRPINNRKII